MTWRLVALVVLCVVVASPSASLADEELYQRIRVVSSKVWIYYKSGVNENWLIVEGVEGNGTSVSYGKHSTPPSVETYSWGVDVIATTGNAFGPGECLDQKKIMCSPITLECACLPNSATWCDTDEERPASGTVLSYRLAGVGCS